MLFVQKDGGAWQVAGTMSGGGNSWWLDWNGGAVVTNQSSNLIFYAVAWAAGSTGEFTSGTSSNIAITPQ